MAQLQNFLEKQSQAKIKKKTDHTGQLGYGMSAEGIPDTQSRKFSKESVEQFGQAHTATQAAIESLTINNSNLTTNIAASVMVLQKQMHSIQASLQNLAMADAN